MRATWGAHAKRHVLKHVDRALSAVNAHIALSLAPVNCVFHQASPTTWAG
jgi:hypothetical protein